MTSVTDTRYDASMAERTERLTNVSIDRDTAADLKLYQVELERTERRRVPLGEVIRRLLDGRRRGTADGGA
jgi:hypothetical protein